MTIITSTAGPDGSILTVTIANPPVNCLSAEVRHSVSTLFEELADDGSATLVVILRGDNHRFSAGGDVYELAQLSGTVADRELHSSFAHLFDSVRECPIPVIAAIEGYAMGGGLELALCCDLRYVTPESKLAASGANMGLVESAHTLPARIPPTYAAELLFTGRAVSGPEAERTGLATRCIPTAEFDATVTDVATQIASRAPGSIRATKEILRTGASDSSHAASLAREHWLKLRASADHQEALAAFKAGRPPRFQGR